MVGKGSKKTRSPQTLDGLDIPALARYISSGKCNNIVLMLGAGVSTSAGIPDFRSPETGLYANLARLNLPFPEAVFEINFFRRNPIPFYTLAKELYPGKFRPTITHSFIKLLASKNLLQTCFTQNIDTLERRAGVPGNKIIEAHGSFAKQRCINCKVEYDDGKMKEHVLLGQVAKCDKCGGYVKPDIVFFGEALPPEFIRAIPRLEDADLLIVMGTSLTVHPFASLAEMVDKSCPRALVNLDRVGDFGSRADDVILLGKCDDIVQELAEALGWTQELQDAWAETANSVESDEAEESTKEEKEVDVKELTDAIGKKLSLNEEGANGVESPSTEESAPEEKATGSDTSLQIPGKESTKNSSSNDDPNATPKDTGSSVNHSTSSTAGDGQGKL